MSREWKPGDVAMVNDTTRPDAPWKAATCIASAVPERREAEWLLHESGGRAWGSVSKARPLVVLDLSEEPVEGDVTGRNESRLLVSMLRETAENFFTPDAAALALKVADQIESQTRPPKPAEPTGLGAVVEDECGCHWVLYTHPDSTAPWTDGSTSSEWSDVHAVRVLSKGVQQEASQ